MRTRHGTNTIDSFSRRALQRVRLTLALLAGFLCLVPVCAQAPRLSVLFVGAFAPRAGEFEAYRRELAAQGIESTALPQYGSDYSQPTLEYMKEFKVVAVVAEQAWDRAADQPPAGFRDFCARLWQYHQAGGGVLLMPAGSSYCTDYCEKTANVLLQPYGLQALTEIILDPDHTYRALPPLFRWDYFWTTDLTPHPVTAGVQRLFLPVYGDHEGEGVLPLVFGPGWQVLARALPSAHSAPVSPEALTGSGREQGDMGWLLDQVGTYKSAPPLLAVRDAEGPAGRLAVLPVWPAFTVSNWHNPTLGDVAMARGDGQNGSDLAQLLLNTYRWLGETPGAQGLGGFTYSPPPLPDMSPVNWDNRPFPAPGQVLRGLIGAHSRLSDGAASVSDYLVAARRLGLAFVVFTEPLEKMDAAKFAQLQAQCAAASTADCAAFPGLEYEDVNGYHYADFVTTDFPDAKLITADGKLISPTDYQDNTWHAHGTIMGAHLPLHPWYFHHVTSFAVMTYEAGRLVDDALPGFLDLSANNQNMIPFSLTRVHSVPEMEQAVRDAHLVGFLGSSPAEFRDEYVKNALAERFPQRTFLTSGPLLEVWECDQFFSPFRPLGNQTRIRLAASSAVGLREVRLVDARTGRDYRRFALAGEKSWQVTVDESGAKQPYLVPIITDQRGCTAIGPVLFAYQDGNRAWIMGDRYMAMNHLTDWDLEHKYLVQYGGPAPGYHKGILVAGMGPNNPLGDSMAVAMIDGGFKYPGVFEMIPGLNTTAGAEPKSYAYRYDLQLASHDLIVTDYLGLTKNPDDSKPPSYVPFDQPPRRQIPTELADYKVRYFTFRPDYRGQFYVSQVTVEARLKKDVTLQGPYCFWLGQMRKNQGGVEGEYDLCFLRDSSGQAREFHPKSSEEMSAAGVLNVGDYVAHANYVGGTPAVMALTDGLHYTAGGKGTGLWCTVYLGEPGQTLKAGTTLRATYLAFCKSFDHQTSPDWLESFRRDFGLAGAPPAYSIALTRGTLLSSAYTLDLQAAGGGAEVRLGQAALPCRLPVAVHGLNPNLPAGIYEMTRDLLRALPIFEGAAYATVDLRPGPAALYVGNLLLCDQPEIFASLVPTATGYLLEVHNPTTGKVTTTLRAAPGFTPLAGWQRQFTLAPGTSERLSLPPGATQAQLRPQAW